ncbi:hypothetical protein GOV03_01190 [Candidatus Woesearchaeota archaeon]|nr:hypothetical protein [Candidatus Woesearchaeota archaeon]
MKRGTLVLLVLGVVLFSSFVSALETDCLYYFYGEGDVRSEATGIFLDKLNAQYTGLKIHSFEIYYDKENLATLEEFLESYEVPTEKQGVPIVFLSQSYFVGEKPIVEYLEKAILSNHGMNCPSLKQKEVLGVVGETSPKHLIDTLTFFSITGAAIIDSVDACAIAILLILLVILLILGKNKKALMGGISFIVGVYVAYALLGTGVLGTFTQGYYFPKVVGGLAILLGLIVIRSFLKGKLLLKEMQEGERFRKAKRWLSFPATVALIGFLISLFGFSANRRQFAVISSLLTDKLAEWAAMPLLLYYLLIFILPLVILTVGICYIMKAIEKNEKGELKNTRLLHSISGAVMVVLGIIILIF